MTLDAETDALLKILELGKRQAVEGKLRDARQVIAELRRKLNERQSQQKS